MGWFSLGGNLGFATAPLLVVPALAGAGLSVAALRSVRIAAAAVPAVAEAPGRDDRRSFLRLSGAVICRSIVFVGLSSFVSLFAVQRVGGGEAAGTAALFVLYIGGAFGTVAGGRASPAIGAFADTTSLQTALAPLIVLPAVGWLLLRGLREPRLPTPLLPTAPYDGRTEGRRQ